MDTLSLADPHTVPTKYWHELPDGRIQCDICPRNCRLHEGQRGLCFVRGRIDNQVVLASYGRSSGFCVDPVEKKPLNHFLPGTAVLSFGTAGCNLACRFCQNWDISKSREIDTLSSAASPEALAVEAERLGCRSVAFTYNDPVIFMEYAMDVADACHARSAARNAGPRLDVALPGHDLVVQVGRQHAHDRVQRFDAREPAAAHAARLGFGQFLDFSFGQHQVAIFAEGHRSNRPLVP